LVAETGTGEINLVGTGGTNFSVAISTTYISALRGALP
jgi:hypothetical protein